MSLPLRGVGEAPAELAARVTMPPHARATQPSTHLSPRQEPPREMCSKSPSSVQHCLPEELRSTGQGHWDSEEQTKRITRGEQFGSSSACELGKNGRHSKATQLSEV